MADAQFVIDIAASLPDGEATSAQLNELASQLVGAGKDAEVFSQAIVQVSEQLKEAQAVNKAAQEALAAGRKEYAALDKAAKTAAIAASKAADANGGVVPDAMLADLRAARAAVAAYDTTLDQLQGAAAGAAKRENELATSLRNVQKLAGATNKQITGSAERLSKLQGALGAVGGPLGTLGQRAVGPAKGFTELSGAIGSARAAALLGVVGFAALATAIVAVTVAAVAGTIKVAAWAVGLADSRRNAELATEAFNALNPSLASLPFGQIAAETGQSSAALRGFAKDLQVAGVKADDMADALQAVALHEAALGSGGSREFIEQIKKGDKAVKQLASDARKSLGGIVTKQLQGLDAQSAKFKANISDLFGGLNIEPVLNGLQTLVGLFDKSSESGKTVKLLFETIFQPIIDQAENAAYVVEAFALGFLIGLTKVYIALKPAIKAIGEFFGFEDTSLADVLSIATKAGEIAAYVFVGFVAVFGAITAAVGLAVAAFAGLVAAVIAIPVVLGEAAAAIMGVFVSAFKAAVDFIRGIDVVGMGRDLIMGLVNGITGAAGAVVSAITGAVGGAINAAKSMLGIASPSKVFAEIGENTAAGMTEGVESGTSDVQSSLETMAAPPTAALTSPTDGAGGGSSDASSGAGITLQFNAPITFEGVKDAPSGLAQFAEMVTLHLESVAART